LSFRIVRNVGGGKMRTLESILSLRVKSSTLPPTPRGGGSKKVQKKGGRTSARGLCGLRMDGRQGATSTFVPLTTKKRIG